MDTNYAPSRWIPLDARSKRKSLIDLPVEMDAFFSTWKIDYFVFAGTALGVEREHAIIQHDNDVDMAMFKDQLHLLQHTRISPSEADRFVR